MAHSERVISFFHRMAEAADFAPPSLPPRFSVSMPQMDSAGMSAESPEPDGDVAGLVFGLKYCDASGDISSRRVTCRKLERHPDGGGYLWAWCHERQATRQFRLDRIEQIVDWRTGEVFADPIDFLGRFSCETEQSGGPVRRKSDKRAFDRCRDGIRILMFLARCDGFVHPDEREAVARYCACRCDGNENMEAVSYDVDELLAYADHQYPDRDTFLSSASRIINKASSGGHVRLILRSAKSLAITDGRLDWAEVSLMDELNRLAADFIEPA